MTRTGDPGRPLRVLLSAFGCAPGRGSEPEAGLRALLAAAARHEVWVLTIAQTVPALRAALVGAPEADRIHIEGLELGIDETRLVERGPLAFHRFYDAWQRRAARRGAELHAEVGFDLAHHATLAAYWVRCGVAGLGLPLVLGPVGGGVETPWSLVRELGPRGLGADLVRVGVRRGLGRFGPCAHVVPRAEVVLAQNSETAAVIQRSGRVGAPPRVLPNASAVDLGAVAVPAVRRADVCVVGRLIPWKGGHLAVRTLRHLTHPTAVLRFFGSGPERGRIERAARRWGVAHRVRFEGTWPRQALLEEVAGAGVVLHPALHEEASFSCAEALTLGTPLVALARGGPAHLVPRWPHSPAALVRVGGPEATAEGLATAIDRFLAEPCPVAGGLTRPAPEFADEVERAYRTALLGSRRGRPPRARGLGVDRRRWIVLPSAGRPRWTVPQTPRRAAANGLLMYKPVTLKAVMGWSLTRAVARVGGLRLLGWQAQAAAPVEAVWAEGWIPAGGTLAVGHGRRPGRHHLLTLDARGNPHAMVKVAQDDQGGSGLTHEAAALRRWGGLLPAPVRCPELLHHGQHVLVTGAVPWNADARPWRLPQPVAAAMGTWYRRGAGGPGRTSGPAHGDFTPWNLLRVGREWVLCDWADAEPEAPAFFDVLHWLVSAHALLGRPSLDALLAGLNGRGWAGAAIAAWADGAGLARERASDHLRAYLEATARSIDPEAEDGRRALRARDRLTLALDA